jgi:hypothetical protein
MANEVTVPVAVSEVHRMLAHQCEQTQTISVLWEALGRFVNEDGHVFACGNGGENPEDCSPLCVATRASLARVREP